MNKIFKHVFGVSHKGTVDRIGFWTALLAIATFFLAGVVLGQLHGANTTSRADFIRKFSNEFFTQKNRDLVMLFEYDLLKFKVKTTNDPKDNKETQFHYFETDTPALQKIAVLDKQDMANFKPVYSTYEVDDDLLGFFDDIGNYEKQGLISVQMVDEEFGWYIKKIWRNAEVQKYIQWSAAYDDDAYEGFESIYHKCINYEKSKPQKMLGKNRP